MLIHAKNRCTAVRYLFAVALMLAFAGERAPAEEPTLSEMNHTMWTAREGAPQGVLALAQSPDGILWIGCEGGLFTFDGHSFNGFQPRSGEPELPAGAVTSVFSARDGTIWAGFYEGGIARIVQGHMTVFKRADEEQLRYVTHIRQSADGSIWALTLQKSVVRFGRDGTWHVEPPPDGTASIYGMFIDSSDTLWLAQGGRLYRRPLNQSAYTATDVEADWIFGFAEAADRSIWVTDVMTDVDRGRTQHVDRFGKLLTRLADAEEAYGILYAPDGSLILASQFHGLHRFAGDALTAQAQGDARIGPETYTHLEGLSSDVQKTLLLDADGNIWAGGHRGLDRFRKARLTPFVAKNPAGEWQVCANKQGDIWISSDTNQLYKVAAGTTMSFPKVGDIYSIYCANDGDTWIVDHAGIWQMHAGQMSRVPSIPGTGPYGVYSLAVSQDHTLLAIAFGPSKGLWLYKQNQWTKLPPPGMPDTRPFTEYFDSQNRLWTGYIEGAVGVPLEGRLFSSGSPGLGTVYAILEPRTACSPRA
jgi:ligand-binding sensor domain-containing protein